VERGGDFYCLDEKFFTGKKGGTDNKIKEGEEEEGRKKN